MYKNIPSELKDLKQWVTTIKGSKMPVMANEEFYASTIDQSTWSSFSDAVSSVENGSRDEIGFVFTKDDPYVGIDLDDIKNQNQDKISNIILKMNTFLESSVSGNGLHIIGKGKLYGGGKQGNGIEIYDCSRFFIMTGSSPNFHDIKDIQNQLQWLMETYMDTTNSKKQRLIYKPIFAKLENGKIPIKWEYPTIEQGSRNLSLLSLGGQLEAVGFTNQLIYRELLKCNSIACDPPLPLREIEQIVKSIIRYRSKRNDK